MALKWGIASAGKISNDFVNALDVLPQTDHQVVAVAARSLLSAQVFAQQHKIPAAYEGYINLAEDPNVDIVYVGVLNPQHYEVTKMMLEKGKHVLCEKPFTMNEKQTSELLKLSQEKNVFLMEAVWSRCFPVYQELRKILDSGELGKIYEVHASFGFDLQHVERLISKEMGGGATLDLGVYTLQLQQFVYRGLKPSNIIAAGHLYPEGTDQSVHAILSYPEGKTAVITATAMVNIPPDATITGTKGVVVIPQFWAPTKLIKNGETFDFPLIENKAKFNFLNGAGLAYEAEEVRKCIQNGKLESDKITHDETLHLAQMMDTLRLKLGVTE